ncbi:hypothetical protein [Anaeromyxobacter diazotrophicus]|uniref:Porin n=1 Tax=Anaeromyxobacter diazotrophicus TaxID=2590199 RepID=A0A7I9VSX1_9BACT|nr:hypothetical protein [Anaeromyxobacter diazotrophicus]GEJ59546.1 hypothetical protein AMYX_42870 [Anaeromyxobacter diazotrophicus]
MRTRLLLALAAASLLLAAPSRAPALGAEQVSVNGFGAWTAGYTDRNPYQTGAVGGRWDDASFALAVAAQPGERLSVAAQLFFTSREGTQAAALDWAFATWRFSDALSLRVGRVKEPFGIYGEILDVGILRPFQSLPSAVYGPGDFMGESYLGAGLTGSALLGGGWALGYDLFLGELLVRESLVPLVATGREQPPPGAPIVEDESHGRQLGGRLVLSTPLEGLSLRATGAGDGKGIVVGGPSVEYLTDAWSVRAEGFYQQDPREGVRAWAGYVEVARRLGPHWQLAARLDGSRTWVTGYAGDSPALRHRDLAAGVNYWFSPDLVVRAALHDVDGNRFAAPEAPADVAAGLASRHTRLLEAGAQFAF